MSIPRPGFRTTTALRSLPMLACALVLSACSTARPWLNVEMQPQQARDMHVNETRDPSLIMAVTLSGGGARAAAFGYGVLRELDDHRFELNGKPQTLLETTDVISGVSGGSIVAAYYAAFGRQGLPRFEQEFLRQDFQKSLTGMLLNPGNLHALSSPWFGRSHLLARRLDGLYQGKTFADVESDPRRPQLIVTATDLSRGTGFEFTWDQFRLICSDLGKVPLSFAVAASSAVPLLLSPVTLRNYASRCPNDVPSGSGSDGGQATRGPADFRKRLYRAQAEAYRDENERPYIHLVDGGLADNLGIQRLLDRALMDGGLRHTFREVVIPPGAVRRVVLVVVNAEREPSRNIDLDDQVPGLVDVAETLLFGTAARVTHETQEYLRDVISDWRAELGTGIGSSADAFAPGADVHVIAVSLRDAPPELNRNQLMSVPTAFSVSDTEVTQLIAAGRQMLRRSPEFQELVRALNARVTTSTAAEPEQEKRLQASPILLN